MTNEVNNQTEEAENGKASAAEQSKPGTTPEAAAVSAQTEASSTPEVKPETTAEATPEAVQETAPEATPEVAPVTASTPVEEKPADEHQNAGDIDFGAILEQFEQEQTIFHSGELVEGKVVGVSDRGVLIDFGYKSEGIVPVEDFTGPDGELTVTVGDTVEVVIRTIHTGDAPPQLSRSDALNRKAWGEIEAAYKEGRIVTGRIVDKTKGGLRVDLNGIEAFLPGSQIDSRPIRSLDSYKGQDIEAKIIKFSRRRNNIVLSRKVLTDEVINQQKSETLAKIDIGYIVEGTIKNLTEYGAFVDIGGIDGLLHVTDMSWGRIHHPGDLFKVGDHIQVKVLKLDREKEKVSLGYKQLLPDPWSTVVEVYPVDSKVKGKVSSVTEYGVFVELEPGVEGLVHVSEISWSKRSQSPKKLFHKGDEVEVQVLGVDTVEKRISLGMKQFHENPWDTVDIRYPVGSKIHGRVRNLTDFGAFVELEEGIDGLVHVSDITWAKKVKHPKEILKKDQEVDAIVTNIDKAGQRLSLSMKDLMPSAWEGFVATHRPGDVVRGKVSRFTSFGVFVELGEGLEGLCHISELSDERVERPEQVAELGQEMDFKILRIEHEDQKIGLSHRAVGKDDEPVVDAKMYSTEAKGGMASLGELANLKFGKTEEAVEEAPKEKKKDKKKAKEETAEAEAEAAPVETETAAAEETPVEASETNAVAESPAEAPAEAPVEESPEGGADNAVEASAETLAEEGEGDENKDTGARVDNLTGEGAPEEPETTAAAEAAPETGEAAEAKSETDTELNEESEKQSA